MSTIIAQGKRIGQTGFQINIEQQDDLPTNKLIVLRLNEYEGITTSQRIEELLNGNHEVWSLTNSQTLKMCNNPEDYEQALNSYRILLEHRFKLIYSEYDIQDPIIIFEGDLQPSED